MNIDKTDYISYLMEVIQQIWSEKISSDSVLTKSENPKMAAMKIQDGALVTSCDVIAEVW